MKKYKLTDTIVEVNGRILHQIQALKSFGTVIIGQLGGYVESEKNLSHMENAWVSGNAKVYGNAEVSGNARVCDNAEVCGYAEVCGNAEVSGNARVCGYAEVHDNACVYGNALVYGNARVCGVADIYGDAKISSAEDYIVFKNWWSSGRYFTWTRSNNMWYVGGFYGTGKELVAKAYKKSETSGREYQRIVDYVEAIISEQRKGVSYDPART